MKQLACIALVFAGCGLSSEVAEYQSSLDALTTEISNYETASATTITRAECLGRFRAYETSANAELQRLRTLSSGMDLCGRMMNRMPSVQFASMCSSMQTEFERYATNPCGDDVTVNHEQASVHCVRMREWLSQQQGGMQPMMGGRCSQ